MVLHENISDRTFSDSAAASSKSGQSGHERSILSIAVGVYVEKFKKKVFLFEL